MKRIICLAICLMLVSCAFSKKTVFLTSRDKVYVVPKDTEVNVLWDDKRQTIVTEEAMILLYRGTFLELQREANRLLLIP